MIKKIAIHIIILASLFSCNSSKHLSTDKEGNVQNKINLLNNKWLLQKIGDEIIDTGKYSQRIPTLEFIPAEKRAFGYGGCNRFSGSITIAENNITFGDFLSTKMACMGPDIENHYLKILSGNTFTFKTDGADLYLEKDGTTLIFTKTK